MAASPPKRDDPQTAAIAQALQDVTTSAQTLVREEIELAKLEVAGKVKSLVRGSVAGVAGGIFAITGLLFLLHGVAWLITYAIFPDDQFFWGFFVLALLLFVMGGIAAFLALKLIKKGSPPKPVHAIEDAQRIKATIQSSNPDSRL